MAVGLWLALLVPEGLLRFGLGIGAAVLSIWLARNFLSRPQRFALFGLQVFALVRPTLATLTVPSSLAQLGESARTHIRHLAIGVDVKAKALTLGITDGDVSLMPKALSTQLKSMSLTHLTAVSGTNCSILVAGLLALCIAVGVGRRARLVVTLAALAGYLVLVGDQPSVVRAAVMAVIVVIGQAQGVRYHPVNLLTLATYLILLLQPEFAGSLGFALSVAATAGVLILAPRLAVPLARLLPNHLALAMAVAVSAQLACLPILVTIQGSFNLAGLVANLLAEPAVAPVTILGFVGAVLALAPWLGWLAGGVFWVASVPAAFILAESHLLAVNVPTVSLPGGVFGVAIAAVMLLWAFGLVFRGIPRWPVWIAGTALAATLAPVLFGLLPNPRFPGKWFMVACDVGQGDATVIRGGGQVAVIDVGRDPEPVNRCLRSLGVTKIDILELTHFDMDHVGGLGGALEGRTVTQALLTQYVDSRPGALQAEQVLVRQHIPIRKVALGDSGWLGKPNAPGAFSYIVLTPHVGGSGSVSSNDGSIAMFWTNGKVGVFTMADLPATGQERLMQERAQWWKPEYQRLPTVLKLSHHGSADQYEPFLAWVHPEITTVSVGVGNPYGHPTEKALGWLRNDSLLTLRTDKLGSIALSQLPNGNLSWAASGAR